MHIGSPFLRIVLIIASFLTTTKYQEKVSRMSNIREFKIEVLEEDIEDLKRRLVSTRWPEKETVEDWTQGIPDAYMRELSEYWLHEYDWRAR